jgi:signal transduction histidine kinase
MRTLGTPSSLPAAFTAAVLAVTVLPLALNLCGVDLGSRDGLAHTILEWSASCTAVFTGMLACTRASIKPTVVVPIVGMALFWAGCMDAFHALVAEGLLATTGDREQLIPLTWAISRTFNVLIVCVGVGMLLRPGKSRASVRVAANTVNVACALIAYGVIALCAGATRLPQTVFSGALITRPWDLGPLVLYAVAGTLLFPALHRRERSAFSEALWLGTIPNLASQCYMAFGSTALFDNGANAAHFLKVVAYLVPCGGLLVDYVAAHRSELAAVARTLEMERINRTLRDEISERVRTEAALAERAALEARLRQVRKLESVGQLAAGIAHEINTPTQYVGDNVRFLRDAFADLERLLETYAALGTAVRTGDPGVRALAEEAEQQAATTDLAYLRQEIPDAIAQSLEGVRRIAKIVGAMREFSHPGVGEKTPVDLNRAVQNAVTVARSEWKYVADMVLELAPALPPVPCHPGEINQAILNVVVNAAHAIAAAGPRDRPGTITVRTRRDGGWAEIAVTDTGTGIPPEIRARVFDLFFTTKDIGQGTGQGLALAHSSVTRLGGTIGFETEVGQGTTFVIRLPLAAELPLTRSAA